MPLEKIKTIVSKRFPRPDTKSAGCFTLSSGLLGIIIIMMAASFSTIALAEEENQLSDLSLEELLDVEVITASQKEEKASRAPGTIYVVTEEMIKERGYLTLAELLEHLPGVQLQRNASGEFRNLFTIRGLTGNDKFIVMIDGFRVSSAVNSPTVIATNYPLLNVKQVEVVMGPASALYGPDAFSGIVNIITKKGDEISGSSKLSASIGGHYGLYNTADGWFSAGGHLKKISLSLAGSFFHSDEAPLQDLYQDRFWWYHQKYKPLGEVRSSPSNPGRIVNIPVRPFATPSNSYYLHGRLNTGNFEVGYMRNQESHSSSYGGSPEYNVYQENALYKTINESLYTQHLLYLLDNKLQFRTSLWRGYYEVHPDSMFVNTYTKYNNGFRFASGQAIKFEEQISWSPIEKLSLVGGFSYEYINALVETGHLPVPFDTDVAPDLQAQYYIGSDVADKDRNSLLISQDFFELNYHNIGTYLQAMSDITPWLSLTAGARFDSNTRYGASFNPRIGLVSSLGKGLVVRILYGEAFLAPSPYQTYRHFGSFVPERNNRGEITGIVGPLWRLPNPYLKPEKLRSVEANISYAPWRFAVFSLIGFFINASDLIVLEESSNETFKGVQIQQALIPVNHGTTKTYGGTLKIDTVFQAGRLAIKPRIAYTISDGRDEDGEPIPYNSRHLLQFGVDLKISHFVAGAELLYRSRTYHMQFIANEDEAFSTMPFFTTSLSMRYSELYSYKSVKLSLYAKVWNLSNHRYYHTSAEDLGGFVAAPQDPLRFVAGLTLDF